MTLSFESLGAFALVLGLLVLLHEFGHFAVAKYLGIQVDVFSIGFGPRLFGFEKNGTDYRLSLLPLGGYVKMLGENPDEDLSGDAREFLGRPKLQRLAVLIMGPTANIATAVILMVFIFRAGFPEPAYLEGPPVVGAVQPGSAAARAGLQPGDRVLRLGDRTISTWQELQTTITLSPGQEMTVVAERGAESFTKQITPDTTTNYRIGDAGIFPVVPAQILEVEPGMPAQKAGLQAGDRILTIDGTEIRHFAVATQIFQDSPGREVTLLIRRGADEFDVTLTPVDREGQGRIGIAWNIAPEQKIRRYPWGGAVAASLRWNWKNVDLVFTTVGKLLSGGLNLRTMSGPIDIYRISGQTFRAGWIPFVQFMALVSLQLGVINLFPFPVLDGGHILILVVEGVIRRDLSYKIKERMMQVGFYLLLLLMGTIVYLDIAKNFFD